MSSKDETRCDGGEAWDGTYQNEMVTRLAEKLTAALSQATNEGADFEKIDFMSFMSPPLVELDGAISGLLEEREGEISRWRTAAANYRSDLDALQRRRKRELTELPANAKFEFAKQILPVVDAVDAAIGSVSESDQAIVLGIAAIGRQLGAALQSQGFVEIKALHEPFDATNHQDLGEIAPEEFADRTVVAVSRRGYVEEDTGKVLRLAEVMTDKSPPDGVVAPSSSDTHESTED